MLLLLYFGGCQLRSAAHCGGKGSYRSITSGSLFSRAISRRRLQVQGVVCPCHCTSVPVHSPRNTTRSHTQYKSFKIPCPSVPTHRIRRFFSIFLQFDLSSFCRESSRLHQHPLLGISLPQLEWDSFLLFAPICLSIEHAHSRQSRIERTRKWYCDVT